MVRRFSPSLVFITETRLRGREASNLKNGLGLVFLWSKDWEVDVKSFSSAHIEVFIKASGDCWRFSGFYGNPKQSQRHHSWELLRRLKGLFDLPWLVAGDFNKIVHLPEKLGGRDQVHNDMNQFLEAIDLGFYRAPLTWKNGQDPSSNIQEHSDC